MKATGAMLRPAFLCIALGRVGGLTAQPLVLQYARAADLLPLRALSITVRV